MRLASQLATDAAAEEDSRHRRGIKRRLDTVTGALRGHDQNTVSALVELLGAPASAAAHTWARSTATWFGSAVLDAASAWLEDTAAASPEIRALAASALGRLGHGDAVGPLMRAWRNDATNAVRMAASDALVELGPPTVAALRRALDSPDVPRRPSLLYLLVQMTVPEAVELLCEEHARLTDPTQAHQLAHVIQQKCHALPESPVTERARHLTMPTSAPVAGDAA